jgi:hypothetical protein
MHGFQTLWRRMSAHESASTIGKKTANWTVGKTIGAPGRGTAAAGP